MTEAQLKELYRLTANRTSSQSTFVKIGLSLMCASQPQPFTCAALTDDAPECTCNAPEQTPHNESCPVTHWGRAQFYRSGENANGSQPQPVNRADAPSRNSDEELAITDIVAKELWLVWNTASASSWEKVANKEKYRYPARKAIETALGWKPRSEWAIGRDEIKAAVYFGRIETDTGGEAWIELTKNESITWPDTVRAIDKAIAAASQPQPVNRADGDAVPVAIYQVMLGNDNSGDWVDVHPRVFEQTAKHRQRIVYAAPHATTDAVPVASNRKLNLEACIATSWAACQTTTFEVIDDTAPHASTSADALTDEQIIALNVGEVFFSETPTKYPEAGHGTQYHAGAPGVIKFARAVLALAAPIASALPAQSVAWDKFPGWLIDHHEGETLTEEMLQQALANMLSALPAAQPGETKC